MSMGKNDNSKSQKKQYAQYLQNSSINKNQASYKLKESLSVTAKQGNSQ